MTCDLCPCNCVAEAKETPQGRILFHTCPTHGIRQVGMYHVSCFKVKPDGSFSAYGMKWG